MDISQLRIILPCELEEKEQKEKEKKKRGKKKRNDRSTRS